MESGLQAESVANDGYDCRRVLRTRRLARRVNRSAINRYCPGSADVGEAVIFSVIGLGTVGGWR